MTVQFRPYTNADFLRVRDFLVRTHDLVGETHNWHIARWEFSLNVSQIFHNTGGFWAATTGIWEDGQADIVAVVSCEGEEEGEVHFQLSSRGLPHDLLTELFRHAEAKLPVDSCGHRVLHPILPDGDGRLEEIAVSRGYRQTERREVILSIDPRTVPAPVLPAGFALRDGRTIGPDQQSRAHAVAFGIAADSLYIPRSRVAFRSLRGAPDYRPDLDIYVIDASGEPVAFCCMWYDAANRAGHLEPVGTDPAHRRLGLGRAAIYEGLRRIAAEGAVGATVGSNQQFYKSIGFSHYGSRNIWEKTFPLGR